MQQHQLLLRDILVGSMKNYRKIFVPKCGDCKRLQSETNSKTSLELNLL